MSYEIVRNFFNSGGRIVIKSGLSFNAAQAHCNDPETSSSTAKGKTATEITEQCGPWFDQYRETGSRKPNRMDHFIIG